MNEWITFIILQRQWIRIVPSLFYSCFHGVVICITQRVTEEVNGDHSSLLIALRETREPAPHIHAKITIPIIEMAVFVLSHRCCRPIRLFFFPLSFSTQLHSLHFYSTSNQSHFTSALGPSVSGFILPRPLSFLAVGFGGFLATKGLCAA